MRTEQSGVYDAGERQRGARADAGIESRPGARNGRDGALANGLGWFSVGLGMAEVAAPGLLARTIGLSDNADTRELLRAAGLREIGSGVGILTRDRQAGWLWARVGGDVMDLALLGLGLRSREAQPRRLAIAAAAVAGVTALDVVAGRRLSGGAAERERFQEVASAITVNLPPSQVYAFWRDLAHLPRFMRHVQSVETTGANRWRWRVTAPAGTTVEWDAELTGERANEFISWRSLPGADVENEGSVHFKPAPGNRGTELLVRLRYQPPAGMIGSAVATLFGEHPEQQLREDLRRFKQVLETGEIARTEASESAMGMARPGQPRPMQPYAEFERGER